MTANNSVGLKVDRGTPAPFSGYLFTERTAKEIAQGWKDSEDQFRILENAYNDLKRESLESIEALSKEIVTLNNALLEDAKKVRRARRHRNFWSTAGVLILGGIAGAVIHNNR